tara:strand:- start:2730 stop:3053 length:324 start_codon:yes stop_codon:yes gene_type:complete
MNTTEKKIHLIEEAEYYADFNLVGELIIKAKKAKPESEPVKKMYSCWQSIGLYVHSLITKSEHIESIVAQYRSDKLRAVTRASKADIKIAQLEKEIKKLKTKIELGL